MFCNFSLLFKDNKYNRPRPYMQVDTMLPHRYYRSVKGRYSIYLITNVRFNPLDLKKYIYKKTVKSEK